MLYHQISSTDLFNIFLTCPPVYFTQCIDTSAHQHRPAVIRISLPTACFHHLITYLISVSLLTREPGNLLEPLIKCFHYSTVLEYFLVSFIRRKGKKWPDLLSTAWGYGYLIQQYLLTFQSHAQGLELSNYQESSGFLFLKFWASGDFVGICNEVHMESLAKGN